MGIWNYVFTKLSANLMSKYKVKPKGDEVKVLFLSLISSEICFSQKKKKISHDLLSYVARASRSTSVGSNNIL